MHWIRDNGVNCLQFPRLAEQAGFFHGLFLRIGLDGSGCEADFNLGMKHGTPEAQVRTNRRRAIGFFDPQYKGIYARQVHGRGIGVLRRQETDTIELPIETVRLDGDALITDLEGGALVIQVADCQPILIIDPIKRVVANVHSGWRGSIQNIIGATVERMINEFNCRPEGLICGIGPSLGPCCAEFVNFKDELPESYWRYRWSEYHFDFWQASIDQLTDAGVRSENISLSGMCTRCNPHLFYSYRAARNTGRFAAVVGIGPAQGDRA